MSGAKIPRTDAGFCCGGRTGWIAFFLIAGLVSGCASVPDAIIGVDNPRIPAATVQGIKHHDIFIVTTRAPDADPKILYSGERGADIGLGRVAVYVPPHHKTGELERPGRLPPDPRTQFAVLNPQKFDTGDQFVAGVRAELAKRPRRDQTVLVFVHGYNTTLASAVLRIGQFVEDTGYSGVPVLFSWASRGKAIDYVYDLNSALHARDQLLETARLLGRTQAAGFDIVAHSMGNLLTVEAMREAQLRGDFNRQKRLRNVVLASPDIDIDVFKAQMASFPKKERRFYVLISQDDKALRLSRRIAGGVNRVGDASADELAALGVTVVDLTKVEDRSNLNHAKFANSPQVVQLIGKGILAGNALNTETAEDGGLVEGLATGIVAIPTAVIKGGGSILTLGR